MSNSLNHYEIVKNKIQGKAVLVAVTKKHSIQQIQTLYDQGERLFAENHALELEEKAAALPKDIQWQFIGHLQKNKVKKVVPLVDRIQSLDSIALAHLIEKECVKNNKTMKCLIELHLATEDTNKTGLTVEEIEPLLNEVNALPHIQIEGLMCMGPHTDDTEEIRHVFTQCHEIFLSLQNKYGTDQFHILSMGMSHDYETALACGSNMVRIGTYLFNGE